MSRRYEVVFIFDSTLEEAQVNERLAHFQATLKTPDHPEPAFDVSHWGKRTLAYRIKRRDTGYYAVVRFDAEPPALGEFERAIKFDESVLRYLIVIDQGAAPVPVRAAADAESGDELPEEPGE